MSGPKSIRRTSGNSSYMCLSTEAHTHSCIQTHIHTYLRAETARRHYMYTLPYMCIWQVECVVYAQSETTRRQCQKRPISVSKETYVSVKRDLCQCQKRPMSVSKETYVSVKRDLYQCQKRPMSVSKETYISVKRDLSYINC
jgi:hypothetical protein